MPDTYDLVCYYLTTTEQDIEGSPAMDYAAASGYDVEDPYSPDFYPTMYRLGTTGSPIMTSVDGEIDAAIISGSTSAKPVRRPKPTE